MQERRKLPRKPLMFYSRIFDRKTGKLLGHLADITPEGFMLIGEGPLPVKETFFLQLELPEGFAFQDVYLKFEAHSIWSRPDLEPSLWDTGFRLVEIGQEARQIIEQIIKAYGLNARTRE